MELTPGFRFFFSPTEAQSLLDLDPQEIGQKFYDRVRSKEWVADQSTRHQINSENKSSNNINILLREFIRGFLDHPQVQ
jgi:Fe-S cluster biosynthesis and repair protein YggX